MVAGVDATVVLERDVLAADGAAGAHERRLALELLEHRLEQIDAHPAAFLRFTVVSVLKVTP